MKEYQFTAPDGTNHTTTSLIELAVDYDLEESCLRRVLRGSIDHYKGWRAGHDRGVYKRSYGTKPHKLSQAQRQRVKELYGTVTIQQLADRFSVTPNTIRNYLNDTSS